MFLQGTLFSIEPKGVMMRMNKLTLAALAITGGLLLSACSEGSSAPAASVASADTSASIDKTTGTTVVSSVSSKPFTFSSGVADFGTTSATTLTLASASTSGGTPSFNLDSSEGKASGDLSFGSCHFTIKTSTFPVGHPMSVGKTIVVDPCTLTVSTAGTVATGAVTTSTAALLLGGTKSTPTSVTVAISTDGTVAVNGTTVSKVTVVAGTGSTN